MIHGTPKKDLAKEPFLRTPSKPADKDQTLKCTRASSNIPTDLNENLTTQLNYWDRFAVMAIQIDFPPATCTFSPSPDLHDVLLQLLDIIKKKHNAFWSQWCPELYAVLIPESDADDALQIAKQLQHDLAQQRPETITVAVSHYPLNDFSKPVTLENAFKALDHAAFFGPNSTVAFDAVSLNISGDYYYENDNLDCAIKEYRAALCLDPLNVNVHNSLGVCLAQNGDLAAARQSFEKVHRIKPDEVMAVYNLGILDLLAQKPQQALKQFMRAYALDSDTFEIPFQIGKLLTEQTQWEQALFYLEAAVALRQDYGPVFTLLGHSLAAMKKINDAIAAYKKAVKCNPNDAAALSALGTLYDAKGENPEICVTFCRQSVALAPDNALFHFRLGCLLQKQNQLDLALAEFEKAAALEHEAVNQDAEEHPDQQLFESEKSRCA